MPSPVLTLPASHCVWCGVAFDHRSVIVDVPSSGGPYYAHHGSGKIGDPDCATEILEAREMREAEAADDFDPHTAPLPCDVAA